MARQVTPEERERARLGGIWLRETREAHGYPTGTEFADALGIKQGRLSSYENGLYQVEVGVVRRIADLLGMSEYAVWRGLRLPLPRELEDDEAIARAWELAPEVMEQVTGLKRPPTSGLRRRSADRRPRVTRPGGKRSDASRGEESAV
jgi:transcriptional regulator with XRE-family HTH domain